MECMRALLRTRAEICSLASLYGDALSNGRNDVSTLRSRGWDGDADFAAHEAGHPAHCHYRLRAEPRSGPAQLRLGVA